MYMNKKFFNFGILILLFTFIFSIKVYGEEPELPELKLTGGLNEEFEIIDDEDFDGKYLDTIKDKSFENDRILGKATIEDLPTGAIGTETNTNAFWDRFTNNYIYNQLTMEEKEVWNTLDTYYYEYLNSNKDFEYNDVAVYVPNYSTAQIYNLGTMYRYAHPQFYFLRPRFYCVRTWKAGKTSYALSIVMYDKFKDGKVRAQETVKILNKLNEWTKKIDKNRESDLYTSICVHDIITDKVEYDYDVIKDNYNWDTDPNYSQTMYSVATRDKTVCAGYAITFSCLANYAGLNNIAVTGSGHAWNMMAINDIWYNVDSCWDDNCKSYKYFLVSDQFLYNNDNSHYKYDYYKPYIPEAFKNWQGYEQYENDLWYFGNAWSNRYYNSLKYNLGKTRMEDISKIYGLPTSYGNYSKTKIPTIDRKGYQFNGWYYNGKKVTNVGKGTKYNKMDLELIAKWEPYKYNISFSKAIKGVKTKKIKGTMKTTKKVEYDTAISLPKCTYTREGYKFIGWTTSNTGTTVEFLDEQRVSNLSEDGKTIKLYALWEEIK